MKEAEVRAQPGEVLLLFRDGLRQPEREHYLHRLFAAEYHKGRYLKIKEQTSDGMGVVLAVPLGWEEWYVALLHGDQLLQFVQRHHRTHKLKPASAGH